MDTHKEERTPAQAWLEGHRRQRKIPTMLPETNLDDADIARRMFFVGCFGLPLFWIVASLTFRDALRDNKSTPLRYWVLRCVIGSSFAIVVLLSWIIAFQLNYIQWGLQDWRI